MIQNKTKNNKTKQDKTKNHNVPLLEMYSNYKYTNNEKNYYSMLLIFWKNVKD